MTPCSELRSPSNLNLLIEDGIIYETKYSICFMHPIIRIKIEKICFATQNKRAINNIVRSSHKDDRNKEVTQ